MLLAGCCVSKRYYFANTTLHSSQIGIGNGYDDEAISTSKLAFNWILSSLTGGVVVCARSRRREEKIRSYPPFNQSIAEGGGISEQERIARRNLNLLQGFPTSFLMFVADWLAALRASSSSTAHSSLCDSTTRLQHIQRHTKKREEARRVEKTSHISSKGRRPARLECASIR